MKAIVEDTENIVSRFSLGSSTVKELPKNGQETSNILVHCWRGGMRSAGVAWLLDLYGFKVYTLTGGYKAYRKWVREQFEKPVPLSVLGGYTGSGKTLVLHQLKEAGFPIIDLEALANHKGSAFGAMNDDAQPTQEMFENTLAAALFTSSSVLGNAGNSQPFINSSSVWVEDESQRIGNLKIPDAFWKQMRNSNILFLDIPFEERLNYLTAVYGKMEKEKLVNAIIRIQKRLGGLETKNAINFLLEDDRKECFRILLTYYDKWYTKGLYNRENPVELINKISAEKVNAKENTGLLVNESDRNGTPVADLNE
jgi:tRNA 2-selenouridine synthase